MDYDPELWDDYVEIGCNCYAYAINNQVFPGTNYIWYKQQPGRYNNTIMIGNHLLNTDYIFDLTQSDFEKYNTVYSTNLNFSKIDKYAVCPEGTYKVALAVGETNIGLDYHWYRQDSDGLWSHKPGITSVKRTDSSGCLIFDPEYCNRGEYTTFIGYFAVTPWNRIYDEDAIPLYLVYADDNNGYVLTFPQLIELLRRLNESSATSSMIISKSDINTCIKMAAEK